MTSIRLPISLAVALSLATLPGRLGAADAVDDFVEAYRVRHQIPGLSLAICRDGHVVKARGFGLANVELDVPVKPETVFQSGSVGKQFTAMAVLMLVEEGKLGLDDPLPKHFPNSPSAWKDITVRHLLTHTSGIPDWEYKELDYRRDYTEDQLVKVAQKLTLDFAPGTRWSYSNTGYVLLGVLIRKASGIFYGDFLKERVFLPLGMESTRIISEADIVKNRAAGYALRKGKLENQEWVSPTLNTTADGSLYLTALDLARWDAALGAGRLLKKESYGLMWSPVRLAEGTTYPYGFGWGLDVQRGEREIAHGGSWQGFRTAIARYPDRKLTVIALANLAEAEPEHVARTVAGLVEPALAEPDVQARVTDPNPSRTATLRGVLDDWAKGHASKDMGRGLTLETGTVREKRQRERTGRALGEARELAYLGEDDLSGRGLERRGEPLRTVVYCALRGGESDRRYRFYLDERGRVLDFESEAID
jgi:CubicO group peptidase (beta-lactamase class C family)